MTILFAGGEDTSLILSSAFQVGTNSALFRSNFARECVYTQGNTSTSPNPGVFAATPVFTSTSTLWAHCQYGVNTNSESSANYIFMAAFDSSGVMRIAIRTTGNLGQLKISTCNASGTFTDLATSAQNAWLAGVNAFDLYINYSTNGQVTLYFNGVNILDTGPNVNVTTNSATALAQIYLISTTGSVTNQGFSEVIVQTTSTLGLSLFTLPPLAAGNTQSWTGSVGNINKTSISDTTFNDTTSNNALSEWTVTTTLPAGNWLINAVVQEARVSVGTTGPQHFAWVVRTSDGSDHTTGSIAPATSFNNYITQLWLTNPATGNAWNAGELINAGIESLA